VSGVPVEVVGVPADLVLRNKPPNVVIWATAQRQRWARLGAENFRATVDASRSQVGVQELAVRVTSADAGVQVASVAPVRVSIGLERVATKDVRVQVRVMDSAPFGFRANTPTASPERVRVSGPESVVEPVVSVAASVRLENARSKISEWIRPVPQDAGGRELRDLTISPETVLVEVPIDQELSYRSVPVVAQLTGEPALGYQVLGVTVEPSTLTVVGEPSAVDQLRFLNTKPVDLSRTTKDITVNAEPVLPDPVGLARSQPITVKIAVGAVPGSQAFTLSPRPLGLRPDLDAVIEPSTIQITLSGPMPVLSVLTARDIQVNVRLEGLDPGQYTFKPEIVVPPSVVIDRTTPQQVTASIRSTIPISGTPTPAR
jgi:YbbR domain-containing protein